MRKATDRVPTPIVEAMLSEYYIVPDHRRRVCALGNIGGRGAGETPDRQRLRALKSLRVPGNPGRSAIREARQQAIGLPLHHRVALAAAALDAGTVEHRDSATAVADQARTLQMPGGLGNALAPHDSSSTVR